MSQAVIHGNTVYLAGQVGKPGGTVAHADVALAGYAQGWTGLVTLQTQVSF